MTNAKAFAALADPTRRAVFERLGDGPRAVSELAAGLPVSRPAVSQHLKVLKEAGLVTDRAEGARRVYQIDPAGLGQIRAWLDRFWDAALAAFRAEVGTSANVCTVACSVARLTAADSTPGTLRSAFSTRATPPRRSCAGTSCTRSACTGSLRCTTSRRSRRSPT